MYKALIKNVILFLATNYSSSCLFLHIIINIALRIRNYRESDKNIFLIIHTNFLVDTVEEVLVLNFVFEVNVNLFNSFFYPRFHLLTSRYHSLLSNFLIALMRETYCLSLVPHLDIILPGGFRPEKNDLLNWFWQ